MAASFNARQRPYGHPHVVALNCLIVDDNAEFLASASKVLHREGIEVVGTASSSVECLSSAQRILPDVVLVDVHLGDEDGFDVAQLLYAHRATPAVILISTCSEHDYVDAIAASDAAGFLTKSALSAEAIKAVLSRGRAMMAH